jgi:hypothetical protein
MYYIHLEQHFEQIWNDNFLQKSEVLAFIGQEPVRCKITINDKIFEQVNGFKYLGCQISYEGERYLKIKFKNFYKSQALSTMF